MCRPDFPVQLGFFFIFWSNKVKFSKDFNIFFSILETWYYFFETNFLIALTPDLMYTGTCLVCYWTESENTASYSQKTDKALPIRLSFKI